TTSWAVISITATTRVGEAGAPRSRPPITGGTLADPAHGWTGAQGCGHDGLMTTATIRVVITAIAVWAAASWVPGIAVDVGDTGTAGAIAIYLVVGAVLALVNAYVKPVVTLLSLPLLILTLGL